MRRHNVAEEHQRILRSHSRSNADKYSSAIPIDIIIEIFLRLPVKSLARCRCVSKLWASILVRPDFTDWFLARSSARPQLLFACHKRGKSEVLFYFSAPQRQNPDENSSTIAANYHRTFLFDSKNPRCMCTTAVSGFVCFEDLRILKGKKTPKLVSVICIPCTGQSITLPKMKTSKRTNMISYLCYDPIGKQHKVLGMTMTRHGVTAEHQILTLGGTGKLTWRMIECGIPVCDIPHDNTRPSAICINGVLYFKAGVNRSSNGDGMIICFDVRSEKYSFVKVVERLVHHRGTLINYNGKLASVMSLSPDHYFDSTSTSFEMWVLQNPEKHEWSRHVYKFPPLRSYVYGGSRLLFVGVTGANEIAFATNCLLRGPFYVYYYSLERKTIRRVEIKFGLEASDNYGIDIFVNPVEDVKLMKLV